MAKKIYRFTQATADEIKSLLSDSGKPTLNIAKACNKLYNACHICGSSGIPAQKRISLSPGNEAFNKEVQADCLLVYIHEQTIVIFNKIDTGTAYTERTISSD